MLALPTFSLAWEATLQWVWAADSDSLLECTPVVVNLTDDNGDGVVDGCDNPEVAWVTKRGRIIVVDGTTGEQCLATNEGIDFGGLAVADLVGDALPEIIVIEPVTPGDSFRIVVFDATMTPVLRGEPDTTCARDVANLTISVADLNKDGTPEILVGPSVFEGNTGELLWRGTEGQGHFQMNPCTYASTAADLDMDGTLEVLAGNTAYSWGGSILWEFTGRPDGASAVGNYFKEGPPDYPEVVFVARNRVIYLLDDVETDSPSLVDSLYFGGGSGGVTFPALGQLDDDDEPEVVETNGNHLLAFDFSNGEWDTLWAVPVRDPSYTKSGASLADLDGDGYDETAYRDRDSLRIVDHAGNVLWSASVLSGTSLEYPVIADIDGDDKMEVVITGSDIDTSVGVSAFECSSWVDGRRIWNDYTYHVTNINEDGTVPDDEDECWLANKSFLAQENACILCDREVFGNWTIDVVMNGTTGPFNAIALRDGCFPHIGFPDDNQDGF